MLLRKALAILVAAALAFPTSACAQERYPEDPNPSNTASASPYNLPIGQGSTAEAIAHAYTMPAVQTVLSAALSRGYVAHQEDNRAVFCSDVPATAVILSFEKLGLVPPAGHIGAPLIIISSVIGEGGLVSTQTQLALHFVNQQTGAFKLAEEFPGFEQDGISGIYEESEASGGGGLRVLLPEGSGTLTQQEWIECGLQWGTSMMIGAGVCTQSALANPALITAQQKLIGATTCTLWASGAALVGAYLCIKLAKAS
jgi:hypothetical protein